MSNISFLNRIFIRSLLAIRPLLGPSSCRFCVSCTDYAVAQFSTQPWHKALLRSTRRVLLCSPLTPKRWLQKFE